MTEPPRPEPVRIIFDSDNTMGLAGCDIDDGLALLFALAPQPPQAAHPPVFVEGICSSYGNSTLEAVHANTQNICRDLGLDIPLMRGATDAAHPDSEAAHFIVEAARANPGALSLAVTGSTTNLKGALALDADILSRYKEVVLMGGITQTLAFNGTIMNELNFSCDPQATLAVLDAANRGANIVVATANNCLPCHFFPEEFKRELTLGDCADGGYLYRSCAPWFDTMQTRYGVDGFCCWDVLVSAYIVHPQLFTDDTMDVALNPRLLAAGFFDDAAPQTRKTTPMPQAHIGVPRIKDAEALCALAYQSWRAALQACANKG
ncbi:MAG: nucleoside hydrolase [Raoultibacter sp.]